MEQTENHKCTKCGEEKALTKENFQPAKTKFGFTNQCKVCIAAKNKAWNEANKEKKAARNKVYNKANKEKNAAGKKVYREANKEGLAARKKAWQEANKEKVAAGNKVYREAKLEEYYKEVYPELKKQAGEVEAQNFNEAQAYSVYLIRFKGEFKNFVKLGIARDGMELRYSGENENIDWTNSAQMLVKNRQTGLDIEGSFKNEFGRLRTLGDNSPFRQTGTTEIFDLGNKSNKKDFAEYLRGLGLTGLANKCETDVNKC